jgi:hypothetical protein
VGEFSLDKGLCDTIERFATQALAEPGAELAEDIAPYEVLTEVGWLNEFLLLVKPELTTSADRVIAPDILARIMDQLGQSDIRVGAIRALSGAYVQRHNLIGEQYPILAAVAARGLAGCPECVGAQLAQLAEREGAIVVSATEFLEMHEALTAWSLSLLCDNVETVKVSAGVYASRILQAGYRYLVLNAFHPEQAAWLSRFGSSCVALQCTTRRRWPEIRAVIVGGVDPAKAPSGSLRRSLYEYLRQETQIRLTVARNGVHVSPGPIEAAFQLSSYFQVPVPGTHLGSQAGISPSELEWMRKNPEVIVNGRRYPLAEAQEDLDTELAVRLVRSLCRQCC